MIYAKENAERKKRNAELKERKALRGKADITVDAEEVSSKERYGIFDMDGADR